MTGLVHLSALAAFIGYSFLSFALVQTLRGKPIISMRLNRLLGMGVLLVHGINVHQQVFRPDGVQLGVVAAAALFAFVSTSTATVMSWFHRMNALLAPAYVFAAIAIGFSTFAADTLPPMTHLSAGIVAHIVLSITAYTLVTLAGSQAILVYIQNYHLKHRHLRHLLQFLPPLQTMETMLFDLVATGWFTLTIAIGSGFLFVDNLLAQHLVHKTVFSLAAWLVFGLLLAGRWLWGWRGLIAVRWTLGGLMLLMTGYFGSQIVLQVVLHR